MFRDRWECGHIGTVIFALQAALLSTESQLDSTRLGREVGVRTQVDVLNAQQLLFSARRDLAQSRYTYLLSLLRLEAAPHDSATREEVFRAAHSLKGSAANLGAAREKLEHEPAEGREMVAFAHEEAK